MILPLEECSGPWEAKDVLQRGKWSTEFVPEVTMRIVYLKRKLGEKQRMAFDTGCPPLFYACDTPKEDVREGNEAPD